MSKTPSGSVLETENSVRVDELLEGNQLAAVALHEGVIINGSINHVEEEELYIGPAEEIQGTYWAMSVQETQDLIQSMTEPLPIHLSSDERNNFGFYIGNSKGHSYELKLDKNTPEYPEWPPHSHNTPEEYFPINGEIRIGLEGPEYPETGREELELINSIEGPSEQNLRQEYPEVFKFEDIKYPTKIPSGEMHFVTESRGDPDLLISRGDSNKKVEKTIPEPGGYTTHSF